MKSGCPGSEWIGVGGTWLQLMCCAASRHRVPNFGRQGQGRGSEIGDDFVVRQKSDKDDKGGVPSRGARKGLKDNAQRGLCRN